MEDLRKQITEVTDEFFEENTSQSSPEAPEQPKQARPIDYYQAERNAAYEASQKLTTHGSPAQMIKVVDELVDNFKQTDYNVNKNQYDHLLDTEARDTAEYLRQTYMTEQALPLIESVVETYGVDALINNSKALAKLDEIVLTPNGSSAGFTKGYLAQMHKDQRGESAATSDMEVINGIRKIKAMADSDDIRGSVAKAKRLKEKVDNGEASASEDDYALLLQVSSYR